MWAANDRRVAREPHPGSLADAHRPQLTPTLTGDATAESGGLGGPGKLDALSVSVSPLVKGTSTPTSTPSGLLAAKGAEEKALRGVTPSSPSSRATPPSPALIPGR